MKKQIVVWMVALSMLCFAGIGCSKQSKSKENRLKGTVESVDVSKNEAVIKDKYTGTNKTVVVDSKDIESLKPGEKVSIQLKPGTNNVKSIKLHSAKAKADKADKANKENKEEKDDKEE
ncbi:MAG: hypothetical protein WCQ99_04815 [Pseudomonadota bacterium]